MSHTGLAHLQGLHLEDNFFPAPLPPAPVFHRLVDLFMEW